MPVSYTHLDVYKRQGSRRTESGTLLDASGEEVDTKKTKVFASIEPRHSTMTDDQEAGLVQGVISNLIYKGDHYSYVIHTELEQDFVVDDEYLWNMDDRVGLLMPVEKLTFSVKR